MCELRGTRKGSAATFCSAVAVEQRERLRQLIGAPVAHPDEAPHPQATPCGYWMIVPVTPLPMPVGHIDDPDVTTRPASYEAETVSREVPR